MSQSQSPSKPTTRNLDECCICLADANARAGVPIITPGCCGKWMHHSCLALVRDGKCPACRQQFSSAIAGLVAAASLSAPPAAPGRPSRGTAHPLSSSQPYPPQPFGGFGVGNVFGGFSGLGLGSNGPFGPPRMPTTTATASALAALPQDDVVPPSTSALAATGAATEPPEPVVTLTSTPEQPIIGMTAHSPFYAKLSISYRDGAEPVAVACDADSLKATSTTSTPTPSHRSPLDVVCVLDVSGSMGGSKIHYLRCAMNYVIDTLGDDDRLSIISFSDRAHPLQGWKRMTTQNKGEARLAVQRLQADGGTSILAGMQAGSDLLQARRTKNPKSCMLLLTDGQDHASIEEKVRLATAIKVGGTSLFCYGFGQDHDSAQLNRIAVAAEGPFVYVESDDAVVDCFGGTIGSLQGACLSDIVLTVTTSSGTDLPAAQQGVRLLDLSSGRYAVTKSPSGDRASVSFANMYSGESRDVLVALTVPEAIATAGSEGIDVYPLLSVTATYRVVGSQQRQEGEELSLKQVTALCSVSRTPDITALPTDTTRHVDVDVQIHRQACSVATAQALDLADTGNLEKARAVLTEARTQLRSAPASSAYAAKHPVAIELDRDLASALQKLTSRSLYSAGGRADISSNMCCHEQQRQVYSKPNTKSPYQSASSVAHQMDSVRRKK